MYVNIGISCITTNLTSNIWNNPMSEETVNFYLVFLVVNASLISTGMSYFNKLHYLLAGLFGWGYARTKHFHFI